MVLRTLGRPGVALALCFSLACQGPANRGAGCARSSDCASPLVCALEHCRAECRETRDCEVGARCLVEPATGVGVCSIEHVDDCAGSTCASGFLCSGGQCVNACAAIPRCPDGVCVDGACVPVVGDAGIAPSDAGVDCATDAGTCHGPGCDPVVHIAVHTSHAYALTAGGHVWAWGSSVAYALGDGLLAHGTCATCAPTPVQVLDTGGHPLAGATAIAASAATGCAVMSDTSVRCWGDDGSGQLGNPTASGGVTPVQVVDASGAPITGVTAIAGGRNHFCVIRGAAREVWCWGQGGGGQLGYDGVMLADSSFAARATVFTAPAAALAISQSHTIVLADDGSARGVGDDSCAVLGVGLAGTPTPMPSLMPVASIRSIATTLWNTCALDVHGAVSCWGYDQSTLGPSRMSVTSMCQLCVGTSVCSPAPLAVPLPSGVALEHLSGAGEGIMLGYTATQELYVWGASFRSPITTITTPTPVVLPGHVGVVEAGASDQFCVLDALGDVYCAGMNDQGQLGRGIVDPNPSGDGRLLPVVWP